MTSILYADGTSPLQTFTDRGSAIKMANSLMQPPRPRRPKGTVINKAGFASPGLPTFGPGNNLIGNQINPNPSPASQTAQNYTSTAQSQYAGLPWFSASGMPTVSAQGGYNQGGVRRLLGTAEGSLGPTGFSYTGQTGSARGTTLSELERLTGATPDRAKLAADTYALLMERSQPQHAQGIRALGQNAARLGRVGSGLTTNELTNYEDVYEKGLDQSRRQLATESAGLSLQDAMDRVNTARGVSDSFAGQDTAAGGLNLATVQGRFGNLLDLANMERGLGMDDEQSRVRERDVGLRNDWSRYDATQDAADRNVALARNRFGDFSAYEGQRMGEDRARRNEYRGERDYQYGLSRDAQGDRISAQAAQQDWLDRLFRRGESQFDRGYSGSPASTYGAQADRYGQQAGDAFDTWGPLLEAYGMRRRRGSTTGGSYGGTTYNGSTYDPSVV